MSQHTNSSTPSAKINAPHALNDVSSDASNAPDYNHTQIEEKWQAYWEKNNFFQHTPTQETPTQETPTQEIEAAKDKLYLLFAFAYPSGSGLHVGHVESKTALDILARHGRMNGKNVFFPVGWDAFGLPAENYAIKTGVHPEKTTQNAIHAFRRQIKRLGISYDWSNEIATCHPGYYRWTQWLFLQLYEAGLAFRDTGKVNWCPSCQTVLANEQVVDGLCERCGSEVTQKEMKQWYFKITDYQDELIAGLDEVDWPEPTKQQQLNWIGRKEGAEISFELAESETAESEIAENKTAECETDEKDDEKEGKKEGREGKQEDKKGVAAGNRILKCFTTRPDTVFGTTFIVISPEKFVEFGLLEKVEQLAKTGQIASDKKGAVEKYLAAALKRTEAERQIGEKDKTGVKTGLQAINPVNGELIPIYVADYVLAGYGTGVVMGVPAHDERDFAFAKKHGLEIKQVITWEDRAARKDQVAREDQAARENQIKDQVDGVYDDRQWQAYYAEYGVMINSGEFSGLSFAEALEELTAKFGEAVRPAVTYKLRDWLISRQRYWGAPIPIVYDPDGRPHPVKAEHLPWELPTDVDFNPTGESPLRSSKEFKERTERLYGPGWTPEYDTMDTFVDSSWYYLRYLSSRNQEEFADYAQLQKWLPVDFYMIGPEHIVLHLLYSRFFAKFLRDKGYLKFLKSGEPFQKIRHQGMILGPDGKKMSKSKGNVINPDAVVEEFGADTLRMYEMFMGPIEADKPWDTSAVIGIYRFIQRVYRLAHTTYAASTASTAPTVRNRTWESSTVTNRTDSTDRTARLRTVKTVANRKDQNRKDQAGLSNDQDKLYSKTRPATVPELEQKLHQTIKKVSQDIPKLKFNTAIAAMMEFVNAWSEQQRMEQQRAERQQHVGQQQAEQQTQQRQTEDKISLSPALSPAISSALSPALSEPDLNKFLKILAPFAPFVTEELYHGLSEAGETSIHQAAWPEWNEDLAQEELVSLPVQINGKVRAELEITREDLADKEKIITAAKKLEHVQTYLKDKKIVKEIYVPGKIVSLVSKQR